MPYFLALTLCLCLSSCCSTKCLKPFAPVTYKDYNFFNDGRSPDLTEFNKTVEMAIKGNNGALTEVLTWASLTDGEGSINYANFLLKLQDMVGQERFVKAFDNLPPENQGIVKSIITTHHNLEKFTSNLDKI
jgi:hypothetical protein